MGKQKMKSTGSKLKCEPLRISWCNT